MSSQLKQEDYPHFNSRSIKELQALNRTISHEVKAPVRAIDGYARIFIEDFGGQVPADGVDLIQNIRSICKDTLQLINTLLDYTKYADADPIQETIDFRRMIHDVFHELVYSYGDQQHITLDVSDTMPFLLADSILIRQVLINLLSNALKFTKNQDEVMITVGYQHINDEHIFFIQDNGVGFDMNFSENIFGLFQRMHTLDDYEGSGVGLAIVKSIIHKFGGKVWITGEVGHGACAYFTLSPVTILT